jgi:hypothetical protein
MLNTQSLSAVMLNTVITATHSSSAQRTIIATILCTSRLQYDRSNTSHKSYAHLTHDYSSVTADKWSVQSSARSLHTCQAFAQLSAVAAILH